LKSDKAFDLFFNRPLKIALRKRTIGAAARMIPINLYTQMFFHSRLPSGSSADTAPSVDRGADQVAAFRHIEATAIEGAVVGAG
jgi:hypothetical protein